MTSLLQVFFPEDKIRKFAALIPHKDFTGPLRIFAGGNLEARKGVALALRALARIRDVSLIYTLGGGGPEKSHLQKLAGDLGLANRVLFTDGFKGDAYLEELRKTHVYLLPSLRDSAGITLMEAMLAGCVPIVADCGGPHDIVTNDSGVRIPVTTPETMAEAIAQAIVALNENRHRLKDCSEAAHRRIAQAYSETAYLQTLESVYSRVLSGRR
jgi:glycosyltransferase involved in cell wall biosynthesis